MGNKNKHVVHNTTSQNIFMYIYLNPFTIMVTLITTHIKIHFTQSDRLANLVNTDKDSQIFILLCRKSKYSSVNDFMDELTIC